MQDAIVQDLGIINANISGGGGYSGILAGISSSTIINCYTTGTVNGYDSCVGGLVGQQDGSSITSSYSTATVSSTIGTDVGGLVGNFNSGTISKSFATGNVTGDRYVGGLIGNAAGGTVSDTYSSGNVIGTGSASDIGGFIGYNSTTVTRSYSIGTVTGSTNVGGFAGNNAGTITSSVYDASEYQTGVGTGTTSGVARLNISQMKTESTMESYGFTTANGWKYSTGLLPSLGSESMAATAGSVVYVSSINNLVNGDTYHIKTASDLTHLAELVNSGEDTTGVNFILDNNIDMSGVSNFAGIGNSSDAFKGTFYGNGHTISNLKMSSTSGSDVGFFGNTSGATVQDLAITGASVSGGSDVGILAGNFSGTISNVYTTGNVSGSIVGGLVGNLSGNVTDSYSGATVSGANVVGGLVGQLNSGTVSKSFATGTVNISGQYGGGLIGKAAGGTVSDTYSSGNVIGTGSASNIGGLIGINSTTVTRSYSIGSVSGSSTVGGLIGANSGSVTNSIYNAAADTTGVGSGSSSGVTRLSLVQMANSSTMQGYGFTTSNGWKYTTGKLPTLGNETVTSTAGGIVYVSNVSNLVNGDTYHIRSAADLTQLANLVNSGEDASGVTFVVDNDIDMSGVSNFSGIGNSTYAFDGSFYGNGHTISNLKMSSTSNDVGFFGNTNNATLQDIRITNANVSSTGRSVGILVGNSSNTTIVNSNTSGAVSGNNYVGGLAGIATGIVTRSYSTASVSAAGYGGGLVGLSSAFVSSSFASGSVTGTGSAARLGGFVGQINGGIITDSYSTGNVTGSSQIGGFVGWGNDGTITRSYSTGLTTGSSKVGGFGGNDQGRVSYSNDIYNTDNNSTSIGTGAVSGVTGLTLGSIETESIMEGYGFTSANGWNYPADMTPQLRSVVSTTTLSADVNTQLGALGAHSNSDLTLTIDGVSKTFEAANTVNDVLNWVKTQAPITKESFNNSKLVVESDTDPNLSVTGGLANILFDTASPASTTLTTTTDNSTSQEKYIPPDVPLSTGTTISELLHRDLAPSEAQLIIGGDVQAVVTFNPDNTVQDVINALAGYGITASVSSTGVFSATGNMKFTLAGDVGNALMGPNGIVGDQTTGYKTGTLQQTVTSTVDGSTVLSGMGVNSGDINITNAQNQVVGKISIDNTMTVDQLSNLLSNYGFSGSISNGKYTVSSNNGDYLADSTSNLVSKLELGTWTDSTTALKDSTTLAQMGFSNGSSIGIVQDGKTIGPISFSSTDTVQDVIDTLKAYNIDASLDSNGVFRASSDGTFVLTGDLGKYLTNTNPEANTSAAHPVRMMRAMAMAVAPSQSTPAVGSGYTQTVDGYTSSQALTQKTPVADLTDDTTVGDLLGNTTGGLLRVIKNNSDVIEVQYGADEKISTVLSDLASVGINATIDGGVFTASSSDQFTLGGDVGKALLGADPTITNKDDAYASKDLGYSVTSNANGSTVLSDIGVNSGKIYIMDSSGNIVTSVGIDNSTTIDQTIGLLKPYGIDMSIDPNGKVTVSSKDGYSLSDGTSNLASKLNLGNAATTSQTLSLSTTVAQMGFKDGADLNLLLDGNNMNVLSFKSTDTLQNIIFALSAYGINASVDSNGQFTATSEDHTFVLSSDLGSFLTKGTTGYNNIDTGYTTGSTLKATDPDATDVSKTLTYNTTMNPNSTMADLGFSNGASLKVTLNGNTPYTLSFLSTDKVSDVIYALSAYGITASVDSNGKFDATSNDNTFTLSGSLGSYLTSGGAYQTKTTGYTSDPLSYSTQDQINGDTKLTDLGVATGSLNIVQNGQVSKNTINVTKDTTVSQLFNAIKSYGMIGSIKQDGSGNTYLELSADSDTQLVDGTSNLIDKLGFKDIAQGDYAGDNIEYWDSNPTGNGLITKDMLLSSFDKGSQKTAGSFIFDTGSGDNTTQHIINITSDDTVGSLLDKFTAEGVSATLDNGIIHVNNGIDGISFVGGTSSLTSDLSLKINDNTTYASSSSAITYKTTENESVANFADASTTLGTMNITDGTMSIYVDGIKCSVNVSSSETFGNLFSQIASTVSAKTGQTIQVGFLDKNGDIITNPTTSNNTGVIAFEIADGHQLQVGANNDTTNFATIANFNGSNQNEVQGQKSLYKVNQNSIITQSGLFRSGDVTTGSFTIGDAQINIDNTTTISDLINQINNSDKSYASAYWDTLSGSLVVQSTITGASLINIEAGSSNFTDIMGLTENDNGTEALVTANQSLGKNAEVSINGTTVSATSNTITSDISKIKGLTINLKGLSAGDSTTISIKEDDDSIYQAVSDTVDSYNSLMKELDDKLSSSSSDTTDLSNDSILKLMKNNLKYLMTSSLIGNYSYKNLASVGITTGDASSDLTANTTTLSIDKDKFMAALSENSDGVKSLLVGTTDNPGIFLQASNIVDNALNSTGYLTTLSNSLNKNINNLSTKILNANSSLDTYREKLEKQFQSMSTTVASLENAYSNFLNNKTGTAQASVSSLASLNLKANTSGSSVVSPSSASSSINSNTNSLDSSILNSTLNSNNNSSNK